MTLRILRILFLAYVLNFIWMPPWLTWWPWSWKTHRLGVLFHHSVKHLSRSQLISALTLSLQWTAIDFARAYKTLLKIFQVRPCLSRMDKSLIPLKASYFKLLRENSSNLQEFCEKVQWAKWGDKISRKLLCVNTWTCVSSREIFYLCSRKNIRNLIMAWQTNSFSIHKDLLAK